MKSLDKKKTTNEQKWKVVKETISNQDGIIKSIIFTKIPEKKTKELELELFNILNDYGDFFLTDYPKQAETKSIHPTIERIIKLFTQQRTELTCINQPRRYGKSTFVTDKFLAGCKNNEAVEYHQVGWIALSAKAYKNRLEKVRTELLEEILNLECLKEELIFPLKDNLMTEFAKNTRNDLKLEIIEEIKEEITKDLFKHFKQVSNPLDEDYE